MNTENPLTLSLEEARLPGRILSVKESIGSTLEDLCSKTAYDLSRLKGVGDSVIDDLRLVLSFYGVALSGDTVQEYDGDQHPTVAAYRTRLEANYPGMAEKLGTVSDREVGEQFDVSAQSVNNHRRMLGIDKAKRVSLGSKKDQRITALESAINEALAVLGDEDGPQAIAILTAALEPSDEITPEAAQAVMEALHADDDSDDDEQEVEAAAADEDSDAEDSSEDSADEQAAAPATDGPQSVQFDFGDDDFDTENESSDQPSLTFS